MDLLERRDLGLVDRHEDLAVLFVGQTFDLTKGTKFADSINAEFRLQRTRLVVHAGMNHPAVVSRLVLTDPGFLLENDQSESRSRLEQAESGGETDDASADDGYVEVVTHGGNARPARGGAILPPGGQSGSPMWAPPAQPGSYPSEARAEGAARSPAYTLLPPPTAPPSSSPPPPPLRSGGGRVHRPSKCDTGSRRRSWPSAARSGGGPFPPTLSAL